jgi:hypothetical protein
MLIGAWAAWLALVHNVPPSEAREPAVHSGAAALELPVVEHSGHDQPPNPTQPPEAVAAEIVREPPDPFPQDLLETRQRLQEIETRDTHSETLPADDRALWRGEIARLHSLLSALQPDLSDKQVPKRRTETPNSLPKD